VIDGCRRRAFPYSNSGTNITAVSDFGIEIASASPRLS
jgi:hypothetical protein